MCILDPEHRQAWASGDIVTEGPGGKWWGDSGWPVWSEWPWAGQGRQWWGQRKRLYSRNQNNSIRFVVLFSELLWDAQLEREIPFSSILAIIRADTIVPPASHLWEVVKVYYRLPDGQSLDSRWSFVLAGGEQTHLHSPKNLASLLRLCSCEWSWTTWISLLQGR